MTNRHAAHFRADVFLLIAAELLLSMVYLKSVPRFYGDETWEASIGYNIAREGAVRHGTIEGWGGMHIHFLQNQIIQPLMCGLSFLIFGYGVVPARLPSVLMAVISVCAVYAIMRELFSRRAALLAGGILILNLWFFVIARRVRPEIFALAFGVLFLLAIIKSRKGGWRWPVFAGIFCGLAALSHPNGLILSACIFISAMIWRRPAKPVRVTFIIAAAFVATILPYAIYVIMASRNPEVSFAAQMSGGKLREAWSLAYLLKSELGRWIGYFQLPKGLPLAILFIGSLLAAFIRSTSADKFFAAIVLLFALFLPIATVNTAAVYLSLLSPIFAMLLTRLVQRLWQTTDAASVKQCCKNWRTWLAGGLAGVYILFCCAGLYVLLRFNKSDVDVLTNRIAAVTGPTAKVYGNILLQIGADKFNYGYFPLDENWDMTIEDIRSRKYEYVVRLCDNFQTSHGVSPMPEKMPSWRPERAIDVICQNFGTRVDAFVTPGYGAAEIYRIDWNKPIANDRAFMTQKRKP